MKKFARMGNVDVEYLVEGFGPGLLLIHGTGGSNENNWGEIIKSLAGQYKIIAPNYSGSGDTKDLGETLSLEDLAQQNLQAALQEDVQQFHVVGYSLGAEIAAILAAMHPERVISLTLIAGWAESTLSSEFQFDLWKKLFHLDQTLFAQFLIHTGFSHEFICNFNNKDELLQLTSTFGGMLAKGTDRQSELDGRINIRPYLHNIHAPSLVIGLTHDRMVPVENTKELASLIEGARYEEISSGHLVPWEKGDVLIDIVSSFIRTNS